MFPKQKNKPKISNLEILNTLLYILENGCKWRSIGKNWHTIYMRINRWTKNWADFYKKTNFLSGFDLCKSSSGWNRVFKKTEKRSIGKNKGGFNTKIHMISSSERTSIIFSLSKRQSGDVPEGRKLLKILVKTKKKRFLLMDKAYEGDETRGLAESLNFIPVVLPK